MAGRLPKVTEYIKNVGKSVGYATIETVTEPTENVRDFVESNNELFKTIYSATKNYRQTMTLIDRSIKKSKIYEAANLGMKALGEDLRTGKFYNKEREDQYGMSGLMGDEFADFSEFESDNFGDWDDDEGDSGDEESSSVKATAASTSKLSSVINGASEAQSEVIVASAQALAGVNQASTKLLYTQSAKIHSSVMAGFSGVNAGLSTVNAILSGPLNNYMNESTKFYSDMSNKIAETNAYLKELTEMQRNLYKVQQQEYKRSKYDEITTAGGTPELTAYAKNIYKNILALDPTGGMLQGDGDNNMFKMFAGSPLKAIPMMIAKMIVPSTVQATMKAFDENIGGMFSTFIARMNAWAESDSIDGINLKGIIGNLLGIKIDSKSSVDTSKYQRGPIPFDGETKKAIVDVIPQYLARIESAISGRPAQYYDGRSGRFKTMREIHKEYKQNQEGAWASSISSIDDSFKKWSESYASTQKELEDLKLAYKKLGKEVYESGGDFTPYKGIGTKGERDIETNPYFQIFGEDEWKSFAKYLKAHDKKGVYNIANNTFSARSSRSRYLTEAEGGFANPINYLFNDSLLSTDNHGKLTRFNPNGGGVGSYYKKSDKFKSATDYLKDILAEVRYIRMNGVKGAGKKGKGKPTTSFKDFYDANFTEDTTTEDPWVDPNKKEKEFTPAQAEKEKSLAEKMGITKDNLLKEFDSAQGLVDKWAVMKKGVDQLLHKPAYWIASTIEKADKRIYEVFFGDENGDTFSDKHGIKYRGFLDYIVNRTSDIFDDLTDKFKKGFQAIWDRFKKTKVGSWIDEHGRQFASDVGGRLKSKFQFAKNRGSEAINSTYGTLIDRMKQGEVMDADDIAEAQLERNLAGISDNAYGGLVTKYGLTMLSPGEIVIPNPTGRGRDLANEKKEKSRIVKAIREGKISHNAYGTDNKEESKTWSAIKKVMGEVSGNGADVAADALIGTGVSLVTGMIGGPLLGAAAGAGIGIVKNSEIAKKFLFGDVDENGERKGNVIPKSVIDFFNKNSKGMIDFGVAGAIAGLFTPLGLVGGALAGSTLGWAKNTSTFQEFMFGSVEKGTNGLMSPETKEKLQKALPKMGIGAAAGVLLGPFGLVGNAMLGATAGYVTSTDKFKELLFGKEGEDGKKHGGIAGALKEGFVNPLLNTGKKIANDLKDYAKKNIIEPTKQFLKGTGQFVRNIFLSVGDRVADGINGVFAKHMGIPLEEWLRERIFKRAASIITGGLKAFLWPAKKLVAAPFKALGGIGNTLQAGQIARGTMDTMTAKQRLEFRKKHGVRFKRLGFMGRDKTKQLDEILAGSSVEDLELMNSNMDTFIKNRGAKNVAYNELIDKTGASVSDLFDEKGVWASRGHNVLINAQTDKKKIMKAIRAGNFDAAKKQLQKAGLSDAEIEEFFSKNVNIDELTSARNQMIEESGLDEKAIASLEEATGFSNLHKGAILPWHKSNRFAKQLKRLMGTELKSRKAEEAAAKAAKSPEQQALEEQTEQQKTSSDKIIQLLIAINNSMNGVGRVLDETGVPVSAASADTQQADDENQASSGGDGDEEIPTGDDKESVDKRAGMKKKGKIRELIASGITGIHDKLSSMFGGDKKKDENEQPSLIKRIFSAVGGVGSKLLGVISGIGGSKFGLVAAALAGASIIGYGSEFVKTKLMPALEKSETFQTITGTISKLYEGIKDGSIMSAVIGKMTQGLAYTMRNIVGPLVETVVANLPQLAVGIVKGIFSGLGYWFGKGNKKTVSFSSSTSVGVSNLIRGKDDAEFDSQFTGSTWTPSKSKIDYDPTNGMYAEYTDVEEKSFDAKQLEKFTGASGSSTSTDSNGNTVITDKNGDFVASYNPETGEMVSGVVSDDKEHLGLRVGKNAFARGLVTGRTSKVASALSKAGSWFAKRATKSKTLAGVATNAGIGALSSITGGLGSVGSTVGNLITGKTTLSTVKDQLLKRAGSFGSGVVNAAKQTIGGKAISTAASAVKSVGSKVSNVISKTSVGTKAADFVSSLSSLAQRIANSSIVSGIFTHIKGVFSAISESKLGTLVKSLFEKIGSKFSKEASESAMKSIMTKAAKFLPVLDAAFWIKDFADGFAMKTESLLGITKDSGLELSVGARFVIGLLNMINENCLLGLVPIDSIMDVIFDIFGEYIGVSSEDIKQAQENSELIIATASAEAGRAVTINEYNDQEGILGGIVNKIKRFVNGEKSVTYRNRETTVTTSSASETSGSGRYSGKGRGGNQGGIYSNLAYGNSTIGESGCAPVAASMLMNGNVPEAAKFAQMTGHVAPDGSTDIGFFNDYFSAKGITNRTTTNKSDVASALKNGQQAVLLGRDPNGGDSSAYSDSSHFITARGMDSNGNMIIDDPELGRRKMSKSKVLKNMKASVITGKGRSFAGKGRETDETALANADQICQAARSQIGITANKSNNCKYNEEYLAVNNSGNLNDPWCCKFVWWVFRHAGASELFYGGKACASCTTTMNYYKNNNQMVSFSDAQPGDLIFFNWKHNSKTIAQHIGIAIGSAANGKISTVEGNTTKPGTSGDESNGHGVWMKERKEADIVGIARPKYKGANLSQAFGLDGDYAGYDMSGEDTSTTSTLFGAITDFGSKLMKGIFGEKAVDALSGTSESSSSSYSSNYSSSVATNADSNGNLSGNSNAEKIWNYLRSLGYSKEGTAAIMGSLYRESGLAPNNLQNSYNMSIGLSDADYTSKVNDGSYSAKRFMDDKAGYGLAQWTYSTRKQDLYNRTVGEGKRIDDMKSQLDLLDSEINSYGMNSSIRNATNIVNANDAFISKFEKPAGYENKSSSLYTNRLASAREYYNQFKGTGRSRSTDKYVNEYKEQPSKTVMAGRGTVSYDAFLQTIIQTLLTIASNTEAINKILDFLSSTFGIEATTSEVKSATSQSSTDEAKQALNRLMSSRSDSQSVTNILQQKNTQWLVEAMSSIASE